MADTTKQPNKLLFLKRFLTTPNMIGSVTPSSRFLANKMVKEADVKACKSIVELGAGTGIFTHRIIKTKPSGCSFYVFEKDPELRKCLQDKFPNIKLYLEAAEIKDLVQNNSIQRPDIVISGLPFAVIEPSLGNKILNGVYDVLPKGGKFITFQYSLNQLSKLKSIYKSVKLEFVPLNIPPAVVYTCTK